MCGRNEMHMQQKHLRSMRLHLDRIDHELAPLTNWNEFQHVL